MNDGIIASRYAKALLKLTKETGRGREVCDQIRSMLKNPDTLPSEIEPDITRLVVLLRERGRESMLRRVFYSYIRLYHKSENIRFTHLTTTVPAPELEQKLREMIEKQTGSRVEMETSVDPSIIGGFIFEVDDYMLDASVRSQIEAIRRQFVQKNTRIV